MALTNKEKQQALREKRAKQGLVRLEVWVKEQDKAKVKQYVKTLNKAQD